MNIDRAFVRIAEGLVHYRYCGRKNRKQLPLYILHASPASARALEPLIHELASARHVIAPDTLGNGDSAAPAEEAPDIDYFANSVIRILDTLGIEKVDLYGSHTGARTAAELSASYSKRVGKVVLDGITEYEPDFKRILLANYAPDMEPDEFGRHLIWAFQFIRDQSLYGPYFMRDSAHALKRPIRPAENLHYHVVDVLKAITTYHKPYRAAFRYPARERLPLITVPAMVIMSEDDPAHLRESAASMAELIDSALLAKASADPKAKAKVIADFLEQK